MSLQIDVPKDRVHEISAWFAAQGVNERDVVLQSGWLFMLKHYRVEFISSERELAMLFKLAMGGE